VQYRGHFLQLKPKNKRYGPTQAKALICEWEDGAVEVHYRGECMGYEDLAVRPRAVQAALHESRGEPAKQRLAGSLAAALAGADRGAQIIRVHDVAETRQARALWLALADPGAAPA